MILYLAATVPGNEQKREIGMLLIKHRLLSYFYVHFKLMENDKIFTSIKKYNENISGREYS